MANNNEFRKNWRRSFAVVLTATMVANSALPASAFASDFTSPEVETEFSAESGNETVQAEDTENAFSAGEDAAANQTALQERINALPTVEEFKAMADGTTVEGSTLSQQQYDVYMEAEDIADAYDQLSDEEQQQIDTAKMEALFEYFNNQTEENADYTINNKSGFTVGDDKSLTATINVTQNDLNMRGWLLCLMKNMPSVKSNNKLTDSGDAHPYSYSNCKYYFYVENNSKKTGSFAIKWSGVCKDEKGSGKTLSEVIAGQNWYIVVGPRHYNTGWGSSGIGAGQDGIWENCDYYVGQASDVIPEALHKHSWVYTIENNIIKAKCNSNDSYKSYCKHHSDDRAAKLILDAPNMKYSGQSYNGATVTDEISALLGKTKLTKSDIKYYKKGETSPLSSAPEDVGEYVAKVTFENNTIEKEFSITPADASATVTANKNLNYNGTEETLVNATVTGGTLYYKIGENGSWSTEVPKAKNAGKYTIYYYVAADQNHNNNIGSEENPLSIKTEIKQADFNDNEVSVSGYNGIYNGEKHSIAVTLSGKAENSDITYSRNPEGPYETQNPQFSDAMEATTIYYKVVSQDGNYVKTGSAEIEIKKKTITATVEAENKEYDKTTKAAVTAKVEKTDLVEGDSININGLEGTFESADAGENKKVEVSHSDPGFAITGTNVNNYEVIIPNETRATITRKKITVTITANGGSYNKSAKDATAEANGVEPGDTVSVKLKYTGTANDGTVITDSEEAPVKAGTYTVSASIDQNNNPNYELDSDTTASKNFTIAKAKVAIPDIIYKEADGKNNQTADVPADDRYAVTENNGGIKPGSYDVKLELKDPSNYEWDDTEEKNKTDITLKFEVTKEGKVPTSSEVDESAKDMNPSLNPVSKDDAKAILKNAVENDSSESNVIKNLVASDENYTAKTNLKIARKENEEVEAEEAAAVEKAIKSNEKVGAYLDAALSISYIDVNGKVKGTKAIADTGEDHKQTVTMTIPKELKQNDPYTVRDYYVVRVTEKDGKTVAERVDSSVKADQLTFTFDKSTIYVIVYKDTYYAPSYPVTGIKLSTDKVTLTKKGETAQIKADLTPSYADNKNITWKSSDEKVATVDKDGKIIAVGNGTATITATTVSGNYTATATVTVNIPEEKPAIDKITMTPDKKTLTKIGESTQINLKIEPENADSSDLIWKSSDEKVAVVDKNGKVTAVGNGTATITVYTKDGKYKTSVTITVKVADEPSTDATTGYGRLKARSVTQTNNSIKVEWTRVEGADGYIIYGNRCNGNGKTYKYQKLTTITNGKTRFWTQTGLKKGTYYKYIVKAYKVVNGKKVITDTSVSVHAVTTGGKYGVAKSVSVTKIGNKKNTLKVTLKTGKTAQITAKEVKKDKPIKHHRNLCYETSNSKVATVTPDGMLTATGKGTCTVWVYAQNGVYRAITVTVK